MAHMKASNVFAETGIFGLALEHFNNATSFDTYRAGGDYLLNISEMEFIQRFRSYLLEKIPSGRFTVKALENRWYIMAFFEGDVQTGLFQLSTDSREFNVMPDGQIASARTKNTNISMGCVGSLALMAICKEILSIFEKEALQKITWWYMNGQQTARANIYLNQPYKMHDEFYPFIKEGVDAYLKRFLASEEVVFMLVGPPGTGKTSLLRYFLHQYQLNAMLTYDSQMLVSDGLFVSFMMDDDHDVFLIEDADALLTSREKDDNKIMAKFLNVSDGLIKFPSKKLIFTTNISDVKQVDPALTRPGRCFDVLNFRPLTSQEANAAALKAGLQEPDSGCTLAELFQAGVRYEEKQQKIQFGFQVSK